MRYYLLFFLLGISSISYSQVKVTSDSSGALIVRAPKEQQDQIKKIILSLDEPYESNIVKVVPLKYMVADDLVPVLNNVLSVLKPLNKVSFNRSNTFDASYNGLILADTRTNQIILISDNYTNIKLQNIVKQLDKKIKLEDNAFYMTLKNAKASDISIILNEISRR